MLRITKSNEISMSGRDAFASCLGHLFYYKMNSDKFQVLLSLRHILCMWHLQKYIQQHPIKQDMKTE